MERTIVVRRINKYDPALEKRLSIQLYSRQWDEEVSGQVYHQYPMLHIVNLMGPVYKMCPLLIPCVELVE